MSKKPTNLELRGIHQNGTSVFDLPDGVTIFHLVLMCRSIDKTIGFYIDDVKMSEGPISIAQLQNDFLKAGYAGDINKIVNPAARIYVPLLLCRKMQDETGSDYDASLRFVNILRENRRIIVSGEDEMILHVTTL